MAKISNVKYSSDYQKVIVTIDSVVTSGTIGISYCIEENTPLSYIDADSINVVNTDTVELNAVDITVTDGGNPSYPFSEGLVDGIFKFTLTVDGESDVAVRLFARDVRNEIYRMLLVSTMPRKTYDDVYIDELYTLYIIYKGLIYNAVAGQEENVMNILKDLKDSCQIMATKLG